MSSFAGNPDESEQRIPRRVLVECWSDHSRIAVDGRATALHRTRTSHAACRHPLPDLTCGVGLRGFERHLGHVMDWHAFISRVNSLTCSRGA